MLRWCEAHQVDYIVGIAKNERLKALSAKLGQRAERKHGKSGEKVRLFKRFKYRAGSWDKKRCIIAKAEHSAKEPTLALWSPTCSATRKGSTTRSTVLEVRWKTALKNNSRTLQRSDQLSLRPVARTSISAGQ